MSLVTWSQQTGIATFLEPDSINDYCDFGESHTGNVQETVTNLLNSEVCAENTSIASNSTPRREGAECLAKHINLMLLNNTSSFQDGDDSGGKTVHCFLCVIYAVCKQRNVNRNQSGSATGISDFCEGILENCTSFRLRNNEDEKKTDNLFDESLSLTKKVVLLTVLLICFVSLVGNGILIIICSCHSKMTTDCNKIILNLAISDVLFVLLNSYFYTCDIFYMKTCPDMVFTKTFSYYTLNCVCSYNVAALSLQRYLAVVSADLVQHRLLKYLRPVSIIMFIWIYSIVITVIFVWYLIYGFGIYQHKEDSILTEVVMFIMFAIYCFIPLVVIVACSMSTSYRIKKFYQEIPGEAIGQERIRRARIVGSNVLIALAVVFTISYVPYYFISFIKNYFYVDYYKYHQQKVSELLVILNSAFNPIALYAVSGKFRKHFNSYLFLKCKCKNKMSNIASSINETAMTFLKG